MLNFGYDDIVGLPPGLDLLVAGPRWLAPFVPALLLFGLWLMAHLVATKRLPAFGKQPMSKTLGAAFAVTGLGLSIYVIQHHTPLNQNLWWSGLRWHLIALLISLIILGFTLLANIMDMKGEDAGESWVYRSTTFRSPVKVVWYGTTLLSLYLGLTVAVAALSINTAPRWEQYLILGLGGTWLLTVIASVVNQEDIHIHNVYPSYLFGNRFGHSISVPRSPQYDDLVEEISSAPRRGPLRDTRHDLGRPGVPQRDERPLTGTIYGDGLRENTYGDSGLSGYSAPVAPPRGGEEIRRQPRQVPTAASPRLQQPAGPRYDDLTGTGTPARDGRTPAPAPTGRPAPRRQYDDLH
ncbi:MAG TPA: hypothetical protein VJM32_02775 [Candidatus Saccharimonadales bacterium]|nr:hypothetical protein [Candidatus Saccharimonadales bacterium]